MKKLMIFWSETVLYLFGISLYFIFEYKFAGNGSAWLIIPDILALLLLVILPLAFAKKKCILEKGKLTDIEFALLLAWQVYLTTETAINAAPIKMHILYQIMSMFIVALPILLGVVLFKKGKVWLIMWECCFALFALVQYYVIEFRGGPIMFSDIDNIQSAADIKDSYPLFISPTVVVIILQLILMIYFTIKRKNEGISKTTRVILGAILAVGTAFFLMVSNYSYTLGIRTRLLTFGFSGGEDKQSFRNAGDVLTFYYSARYERYTKPDGYSKEKAEEELSKFNKKEENENVKPTIIAIMNESFSDFSHIKDFKVTADYLPFWRSLDNCKKGYVTVSAYGGYSCNSEWEFLSGNSMFFMPSGFAAYTNCMKGKQKSLVTMLKELGYETTAIAPCSATLWNIEGAYEYLGFDHKYFDGDITWDDPKYINGNLSDATLYKKIIEMYEQQDKNIPAFYWLTTMQNHASYDEDVDNGIEIADYSNTSATRYLNMIYESDRAFCELISYFSQKEEPIVIVMFGDHYPHIQNFSEILYDKKLANLSVEEYSLIHQTPYVIWTNKEQSNKYNDTISLNYLSLEVMDTAGLPLSSFQQYLSEVREELPIISGFGYMDNAGEWYSRNEKDKYKDIFDTYNILEYYNIYDNCAK